MRCSSSCKALLDDHVDGTLSPAQSAKVRAHLERCAPCAHLLDELRVVDALLLSARAPELPPNFTFAVMAEVRDLPAHRAAGSSSFLSIVASYLVFAWVLLFAWFRFGGGVAHASLLLLREAALRYLVGTESLAKTIAHLFGREAGGVTAAMLAVLALDLVVAGTVVVSYVFVLPRLAARIAAPPEVSA